MKSSILTAVLALLLSQMASAEDDFSPTQKAGICKVALGKVNVNEPSEYKLQSTHGDELWFTSQRGYLYTCEVFGLVMKLSSKGWGRIQPTGNVTLEKGCVAMQLYDPGLMMNHTGKYCGK